jgi:hypothetical protein
MRRLDFISFLFVPFLAAALAAAAAVAPPGGSGASGSALLGTYRELADKLAHNPYGQPLHLVAEETDRRVTGDAYAVLGHPFSEAARPLSEATQWCEILLLPFNTKHCEAATESPDLLALTIFVGRKYTTPLERTHRLDFHFDVAERRDDYLRVVLTAPDGPFGTRDYRIVLELVPVGEGRAFLHFGYSYVYGKLARAAMQAYLSTIGAHKVGFTTEGDDEEGHPALVRGMRGVMERNTMRYYLAIEAYLTALEAPAAERPARMIDAWFAAVERYPRQLHELERGEYVAMKRQEFERMRKGVSPARQTASSSP